MDSDVVSTTRNIIDNVSKHLFSILPKQIERKPHNHKVMEAQYAEGKAIICKLIKQMQFLSIVNNYTSIIN